MDSGVIGLRPPALGVDASVAMAGFAAVDIAGLAVGIIGLVVAIAGLAAGIIGFVTAIGGLAAAAGAGVIAAAFASAFFSFLVSFFVMAVDFIGAVVLVVIWAMAPPDSARTAIDVRIKVRIRFSPLAACRDRRREPSQSQRTAEVGRARIPDLPRAVENGHHAPMPPDCRLYLITPPEIGDVAVFAAAFRAAVEAGDVGALQVRLKGAPEALIRDLIDLVKPVCRARGVTLILNDDPRFAAALDCDGVHIGQGDTPIDEARRIMGRERLIGVTCHDSRHLAMDAAEAGADYVAFGAFFPTTTKETTARPDPEILEIWQETMLIPCVAIGGITPDNCEPLAAAGADFLAASAAVWNHPAGPAAAVKAFNAAIARGVAGRPVS